MNKYLNIPANRTGGNSGKPQSDIVPRLIIGAIITASSKKYTETDMVDFKTALQTDTLASGKDRIYPLFKFKELADGSSDSTKNTSGYGFNEIVREGKYDWTFTLTQATGLYALSQLRKLNGGRYRAFFVDDNGNILGTQDDEGNFMGAELEFFYAKPWKSNEGSKPAVISCEFAHSNTHDLNENIGVFTPDFYVESTILGLLNLQLTKISTATGKVTIGIKTEGDKVDLYPDYSTQLAVAALWKVTDVATGSVVVPTTVATNAGASGWDVSLTAGTYQISLVDPQALNAASIGGTPDNGYESIPITVTIT